jgi:late competence protein required for DNA uptake (superfamily II DNA/RNA helicase)
MAAKTLKEIINERNFRTAAEKMAFAFGWNAAMDIKEARPTVVQQRKAAICQRCGGSGYFRIFSHPTACFYLCSCEAGKRAAIA